MEAVEIKTEPLDEDGEFNQITEDEFIIKSENEMDYAPPNDIQLREPEVQLEEGSFELKEEITNVDSPPPEPVTPTRSHKSELNSEPISNHCKFCNMFYKSRTTLKLHERNCNQKNDCRLCGQKFVTAYALTTHMEKMHNRLAEMMSPLKEARKCKMGRPPNTSPIKAVNQCEICSLKFANSRNLNNHKKKHNTCQQCGEYFKVYEDLKDHLCPNAPIKEEVEEQIEAEETPTKKIFKATNSMVVIPGQQFHNPSDSYSKAAQPKSRKCLIPSQDTDDKALDISNDNLTMNSSLKSGFSVVTKHTDFEAFAQQMLNGISRNSEGIPGPERKSKVPADEAPQSKVVEQELITKEELDLKVDVPQLTEVDSQAKFLQFLKQDLITHSPLIKEEPMAEDEEQSESDEEGKPPKPLMPIPLPFIKDEPQDHEEQSNGTDATDFLLEELFDRKLKSLAKVRGETANALGFKVKKDIPLDKAPSSFGVRKSPQVKKRTYTPRKKSDEQTLAGFQSKSRRKGGPHKVREDISENVTPPLEKTNIPKRSSAKQPRKKLKMSDEVIPKLFVTLKDPAKQFVTLKDKNSILPTPKLPQYEIKSDIVPPAGFVNLDTILAQSAATFAAKQEQSEIEESDDKPAAEEFVETEMKSSSEDVEQNSVVIQPNDENSQPLVTCPDIVLDADFDFEEAIQSNKLPNVKHAYNVIKSLTEEYKKAEKVKHKDPILPPPLLPLAPPLPLAAVNVPLDNGEANKKLSPEVIEMHNRPCSLFFPILDDTQVCNMVANALDERYRYLWVCPICPREYTHVRPFKRHLLTSHFKSADELEGKAFELKPEIVFESSISDETFCHLCHVNLADNISLRKHQDEMHSKPDSNPTNKKKPLLHKCYICSKLCSTRSILAEHMKSDCGKNPQYGCNVCDKKFHTKSTLNLHKTMHTGELPHSCSFCQKRFRTRGQLKVHNRTHTGEKPFPCKVCNQRFTHRETLIAHLSRHIDMKRYKCYGCDQFFSCISGLKTHRQTRPDTCGQFKLNARAIGPRVRVIKGNVIFEPQPVYNARLANTEKSFQASYILDHNYYTKDPNHLKKVPKQTVKSDPIVVEL